MNLRKLLFSVSLICISLFAGCTTASEPVETESSDIQTSTSTAPLGNLDNLQAMTTTTEITTEPVTATYVSTEEPAVSYYNMPDVIDGFSTAVSENITFYVIHDLDRYLLYACNGVSMPSMSVISNPEVLNGYDFNGAICAVCLGDVTFTSGGIAGLDMSPRIDKITSFEPQPVVSVIMNTELEKFDLKGDYSRFRKGIWSHIDYGTPYIISSIHYSDFVVVTDSGIGRYASIPDIISAFKWESGDETNYVYTQTVETSYNTTNSEILELLLPDDYEGTATEDTTTITTDIPANEVSVDDTTEFSLF